MFESKRWTSSLVVVAVAASGCGQPSKVDRWLQDNHVAIRSSDPADTDFSDLQFLKPLIGTKRVVQLGESAHGTAEFSSVKTRLIKFLHQEMGFEVVAFESGLFDCFRANERMEARTAAQAMRACTAGVWNTTEVLALFEHIKSSRSTARPLMLAGFDIQRTGSRAEFDRPAQLRQAIAVFDPALAEEAFALDQEWETTNDRAGYASANADRVGPLYVRLASEIADHAAEIESAFPSRPGLATVLSASLAAIPAYFDLLRRGSTDPVGLSLRDRGMADNVELLLQRLYPGKKVIVWAHNFHVERDGAATAYPGSTFSSVRSMGSWLNERRATDLYTIGVFMVRGQAAHNDRNTYKIEPPQDHSLEELFSSIHRQLAFVPMANVPSGEGTAWMFELLGAWDFGYIAIRLVPRDQFDALLVVDEVHPPHYI
jgi:erythromycin esterase